MIKYLQHTHIIFILIYTLHYINTQNCFKKSTTLDKKKSLQKIRKNKECNGKLEEDSNEFQSPVNCLIFLDINLDVKILKFVELVLYMLFEIKMLKIILICLINCMKKMILV